jgi:hypothetical protein
MPAGAVVAHRLNTGLSRRGCEPRARTGRQDDAVASQPMPQKDVQHERENAFID